MANFPISKFIFLMLLIACTVQLSMSGPYSCTPEECPTRCEARCSATTYTKRCEQICMDCCLKCLEVPPGTVGNKELTPCYNSLKTKDGQPKCP
ncbi:hypothetical protein AgCh_028714 [Apium graveolens]